MRSFLSNLYRKIRPYIPKAYGNYNGVEVKVNRVGDRFLPAETLKNEDYEKELIECVKSNVGRGDKVTVIGGGIGVSSVVAGRLSDESITVYEPSKKHVRIIRDAFSKNGVDGKVIHGFVGILKESYGQVGKASRIKPTEIKECDVLEMDCEGAEKGIIKNLDFQPEKIIVETHGVYDSPTSEVLDLANQQGYKLEDKKWVDESKDVAILVLKIEEA